MNGYRVLRFTAALAVGFSLSTVGFAQTSEFEPNDPCLDAQYVEYSGLPWDVFGELVSDFSQEPPGDVDFYRFEAAEGTLLRARLMAGETPFGGVWDPYLGLFDGDCNLITANDDYFTLNSRIDFVVPAGGVFIMAATGCCDGTFEGYSGQEGPYTLRLLVPPEPVTAITGRVVDAVTGEPLPGTEPPWPYVELARCIQELCTYSLHGLTPDENGAFRFETDGNGRPLDPANYVIRVWAGEYHFVEIGPFLALSSETVDLGDIALEPPPVVFENVIPCFDIPAEGGICNYSVDVRNNTRSAIKGLGWSQVSSWGSTAFIGYSFFQAEKPRQLTVASRSSKTLRFHFDVPAGVSEGTVMCTDAWFSDRANGFFGALRSETLFCMFKQSGSVEVLDSKEAAARLGFSDLNSWHRGKGNPVH